MNLGKKEGIVVVGEIQKREIMPLTLELIGAAGKLSKERNLSLSVILSGCGIKEEAKKLYNYGVDEILCIEDEKLIEGHMQLHHDAVIEVLKEKDWALPGCFLTCAMLIFIIFHQPSSIISTRRMFVKN